ncbi:hypothetical protein MERGE_001219 [Pneumocystis wakefieldiae]|uniref:Nicotinate-nucleotide pyrophosphorylase [carboxylating] n=1 Tax=Pneumocystis wakefieldiae TaxID=38082 RepID=A0A899G3X2_9ASCO|nr:hypothetical protein MERGE_001219 [Pneumocystis wakefieldiae]
MKPTWQSIGSNLSNALPISWKNIVREWLKEDIPSIDYGGFVVGDKQESAILFGKSQESNLCTVKGILAGVPFFNEIFEQLECRVEWFMEEGEDIQPIKKIAVVHGTAKNLLLGERVALNMLSRCSGIATKSKRIGEKLRQLGYHGILAGTRKTTPGFRLVEKYGMIVGGADPHRFDLSSMIMLKDNHIWSKGSIRKAIEAARLIGGFSLKIEVEVHSEEEADEAILSGADIIMLDNFHNNDMKIVAQNLKKKWKNKANFLLECSGGITEENIHEFISNDLDILSTRQGLSKHVQVYFWGFSKKFRKPVRGGGKSFSTELMLNQDGTLQSDITPKTWREIEETSSDTAYSEKNTSDSDISDSEVQSSFHEREKRKQKCVSQPIIDIENPNRLKKQNFKPSNFEKSEPQELSRRDRDAIEKKAAEERYRKLHSEGKTEKAKADLARLAIVRKEREEKARQRRAEQEAKETAAQARTEKSLRLN